MDYIPAHDLYSLPDILHAEGIHLFQSRLGPGLCLCHD